MTHIVDTPPFPSPMGREGPPPRLRTEAGALDPALRQRLRTMVGQRVLPRLAATHPPPPADEDGPIGDAHVFEFSALAVLGAPEPLMARVRGLEADGASLDAIMLHLLAPAARLLGAHWVSDRLGFMDVTRGMTAIQAVLRSLAPAFEAAPHPAAPDRAILLAPVPGEQHTFGLSMLATFFRRAGWRVVLDAAPTAAGLAALATRERFAAVGLSCAGDRFVARLPEAVAAIRRAAADLVVVAGGAALTDEPDALTRSGVDGVAPDAAGAVHLADTLTRDAMPSTRRRPAAAPVPILSFAP